ncbi:hypothetical protein SAMN06269117_11341 [Balnearium lithotrophicum]|uniref:Uncharacterized protein n=1 Tax=Balnearium lithotrophicum TaxID=223788 RepID=A0A521CJL9_9BACT|nr:hypothetical protein SAMN06269117_11341 [Balnearium lithotrophicum]
MNILCILLALIAITASICLSLFLAYSKQEERFTGFKECSRLHPSRNYAPPYAPKKPDSINIKA